MMGESIRQLWVKILKVGRHENIFVLFLMAIKTAGSAQKYRVGRVSGNCCFFFYLRLTERRTIILFVPRSVFGDDVNGTAFFQDGTSFATFIPIPPRPEDLVELTLRRHHI